MYKKEITDYEEIVSKYIDDYKIRRDELICLCPFHDEDTPSFNFNIKTGLFKCFGCGESGNAVTFVAKMEGIIPAIESAHAVAHAMKIAPEMDEDDIIMICLSGRGDKDVRSIAEYRGVELNE